MNEDKATRYHRLKRQASVAAMLWVTVFLVALVATGWSVSLRNLAGSAAAGWPSALQAPGAVLIYTLLLLAGHEIGALPIGWYRGFLLEHRYGLSTQSLGAWVVDEIKSDVLGLALGCGASALLYAVMRAAPGFWWLIGAVLFTLLIIGLTNLAPVLLLPVFYRVKPIERETLRSRLLVLANRVGARVIGAYELGLSSKTRRANAALAGLGRTRRIFVSDTMLSEYSDDEIEVVLAHELAHHVHGDLWKGIVFETLLTVAGFYAASRVLAALAAPAGLTGVSDVAGFPLLLLTAGGVSFLMMPAAYALSRSNERRADRDALELTRNPAAFISAMRRLGAQHLAEEHPSRLARWLFYSHPPIRERIAAAEAAMKK